MVWVGIAEDVDVDVADGLEDASWALTPAAIPATPRTKALSGNMVTAGRVSQLSKRLVLRESHGEEKQSRRAGRWGTGRAPICRYSDIART